jgi:hypothetical protein
MEYQKSKWRILEDIGLSGIPTTKSIGLLTKTIGCPAMETNTQFLSDRLHLRRKIIQLDRKEE